MIEVVGRDGGDEGEVVDDAGGVRQGLRHPFARLAVLPKLASRPEQLRNLLLEGAHEGEALALENRSRRVLPVVLLELRLVVEHLELAGSAGHEEVDDAFGLSGVVAGPRRHGVVRPRRGEQRAAGHQTAQGDLAQAHAALGEEVPPGDVGQELLLLVRHG